MLFSLVRRLGQRGETIGGAAAVSGHDEESRGEQPSVDDVPPLKPAEPVHIGDVLHNLDQDQADEMRRRQASLERRSADQRLRDALAADYFAGPQYRRFEEELTAYGISVLRGWMQSGHIFKLTADRGFHLSPTEDELEELVRDSDAREELANMTVAVTLPQFRERSLVRGGWHVEGGATLTTYFMGATLYVFPNEFRQRRSYTRRYTKAGKAEAVMLEPISNPLCDPAVIALGGLRVADELRGLDKRTAAMVAAHLVGYGHEEIAEMFDVDSVRAVEGILYRWRTKAKSRAAREEGLDERPR